MLYLLVQVLVSLTLVPLGVAGLPFFITAALLGAFVLAQGVMGLSISGPATAKWARNVFLASLVYLPVLFAVMVLDGRA